MKITGKWIARAGALLLLLGFFLPSVAVSCTGTIVKQSLSLSDLAGQGHQGALYLVLIAALALMGLTFIPAAARSNRLLVIIGQIACLGISALVIIAVLASLYSQVQQAANLGGLLQGASLYTYSLEFGAFILLLGFIASTVGAVLQFGELDSGRVNGRPAVRSGPERWAAPPPPAYEPQVVAAGPRLEVTGGPAPRSVSALFDNFIVGRGSDCHLQVADSTVSRQHFRLRNASGAWFLQDMGSAAGTSVNGQVVQAIRLNDGDQICVGGTTLVFRL